MKTTLQIFLFIVMMSFSLCSRAIEKQIILTVNAPKAIGPYSQAVLVGNVLYLSGQIAIDPKSGKMNHSSIQGQTEQVLENIGEVLKASGFSFNNVVQSQIYLTDLNHYQTVNAIYARYFNGEPPARAVVEVSKLPLDAAIEIMMTAVK